jgi:hypothetical protein
MGIKSYKGTEEALFREMAERTFFSLRLPFSVVLAMHKIGDERMKKHLFRRYEGSETFPDCTIIRSPTINKIFKNPSETLAEFGLNADDYVVERVLSPKDFEIEGARIRQFPILHMNDKNHAEWVKRFVEENYDSKGDGCSD